MHHYLQLDSMMMFGGGYETNTTAAASQRNRDVKTPENFLGENSSLVNLDNLMGPSKSQNIVAPPKGLLFIFFDQKNSYGDRNWWILG
jgi:hypothetical protein